MWKLEPNVNLFSYKQTTAHKVIHVSFPLKAGDKKKKKESQQISVLFIQQDPLIDFDPNKPTHNGPYSQKRTKFSPSSFHE